MDEGGQTFIWREDNYGEARQSGHTCILIESEEYVNLHLDRGSYFLPDGLTKREGTDRLQVFARRSSYIYYRGLRIYKTKEPTINTYNFLCPVELTEDRTAKYPYVLEIEIENYLAGTTATKEVVERAITAPIRTYERGLSYEYSTRSNEFLDIVEAAKDNATDFAKSTLRKDRPLERPRPFYSNWIEGLIAAIKSKDPEDVVRIINDHEENVIAVLQAEMDKVNVQIVSVREALNDMIPLPYTEDEQKDLEDRRAAHNKDDIPF
jgi:hypothetical protein